MVNKGDKMKRIMMLLIVFLMIVIPSSISDETPTLIQCEDMCYEDCMVHESDGCMWIDTPEYRCTSTVEETEPVVEKTRKKGKTYKKQKYKRFKKHKIFKRSRFI